MRKADQSKQLALLGHTTLRIHHFGENLVDIVNVPHQSTHFGSFAETAIMLQGFVAFDAWYM